jgi:hypothetical protein
MIWLVILSGLIQASEISNSAEVWIGLKYGLQKNGKPGVCMVTYPTLVSAYDSYIDSLTSNTLSPKLSAFKQLSNQFTQFVSVCNFQNLFDKIFTIYKWSVLQPILMILAENLTYFIELVQLFIMSIENGFYYNIGLYLGLIIQLLFTFNI